MGPTTPAAERPRGPMRIGLGIGLGHLAIDHGEAGCEMCTHDTPVLAVQLFGSYEVVPRIAIGPQIQFHYGIADGLPGFSDRIRQLGLFGAVQLAPLPRITATGGLGFVYADYSYETSDSIFGGSTSHSQEIGGGPAVLLAGRITLLENYHRTDFGLEGRLFLARLGDAGAATSFSVEAVFAY